MKRAKYRDYERKVLEYLITRTDGGRAQVKDLLDHCKMPKSSLSNILGTMTREQLVQTHSWFNKQKMVTVTEKGRQFYRDMVAEPARYGPPYAVQDYLNRREPKVPTLFPIQKDFVDRGLLFSTENACVFAYPGSGKTLLGEMAMVQSISSGGRALYCTPYKALDWQKYGDFSKSFSHLGEVAVSDGDNPVKLEQLKRAKVIVGTYERVLGALRRNELWLSGIDLICADEISLLAEEERGSNLDLLLTLIKRRAERTRVVTLSSIVGNMLEIADWLSAKPVIDNRPLPGIDMEENIVYKDEGKLHFLSRDGKEWAETSQGEGIEHIVETNLTAGKTTLIFVGTRDLALTTAWKLKLLHKPDAQLDKLVSEFEDSKYLEKTELTTKACNLMRFGIAFHHAGLHKRVRRFIERMLAEDRLKTIVATGTLSHGVDFKIDSVIVDLESILQVHELDCYEYINYKGRAGRPGKSVSATVFVICTKERAHKAISQYFTGAPEAVIPSTILRGEGIDVAILAGAASKGRIQEEELADLLRSTMSARYLKRVPIFNRLFLALCRLGFLRQVAGGYELTELGKRTNDANISPRDAIQILEIGRVPSTKKLISIASQIDMVRNYRAHTRRRDPTEMLLDWINEKPIDEIRAKYLDYWDDGDVLLLGDYTAMVLDKIATFLSKKPRMRYDILRLRLRFGVKEDLVKGGLVRLSPVVRDKARFLARSLFANGYRSLDVLAHEEGPRLAKKVGLTDTEAMGLIAESRRLVADNEGRRAGSIPS